MASQGTRNTDTFSKESSLFAPKSKSIGKPTEIRAKTNALGYRLKKKTTSSLVTKQNCTDLHFHDIDLELKNNKAGRPAKRQ